MNVKTQDHQTHKPFKTQSLKNSKMQADQPKCPSRQVCFYLMLTDISSICRWPGCGQSVSKFCLKAFTSGLQVCALSIASYPVMLCLYRYFDSQCFNAKEIYDTTLSSKGFPVNVCQFTPYYEKSVLQDHIFVK